MKCVQCLFAAVAGASGAASSPSVTEPVSIDHPGFVSFPVVQRQQVRPIMKRGTQVPLYNISAISYLIELSIGTPGQSVKVAIDTGSDELWVNPLCSTVKNRDQRAECVADGQYSPDNSSTAQSSAATNKIPYGKGEVSIQYFQDAIAMPNSTISLKDVIFGVARSSQDLNEGIMGIGYGKDVNLQYSNIIDALAVQNVTKSRAFSIGLGSAGSSNSGVLSFGGVDTKKFSGKLAQMPILGPQGKETIRRYWVSLDSLGMSKSGTNKTYTSSKLPIVIDSGSSLSYLPQAIVSAMANDTGAQWSSDGDVYVARCDKVASDATFDFSLGGGAFKVSIPWRDFFWYTGDNECVLGALPMKTGSITALLGDTFMRSVYTVFDQTSNMVFMAPYASCGSNVQVIPASPAGAAANFSGECSPGQGVGNSSSDTQKSAARRAEGGPAAVWAGTAAAALVAAQILVGLW